MQRIDDASRTPNRPAFDTLPVQKQYSCMLSSHFDTLQGELAIQ